MHQDINNTLQGREKPKKHNWASLNIRDTLQFLLFVALAVKNNINVKKTNRNNDSVKWVPLISKGTQHNCDV